MNAGPRILGRVSGQVEHVVLATKVDERLLLVVEMRRAAAVSEAWRGDEAAVAGREDGFGAEDACMRGRGSKQQSRDHHHPAPTQHQRADYSRLAGACASGQTPRFSAGNA